MALLQQAVNTELTDLGQERKEFSGIFTPVSELNQPKQGVTDQFLANADIYFERFEQFNYMFQCLNNIFESYGVRPNGTVLDFGAGFGNSTIPILREFPDTNVIATDISPNLLAILKNLSERYEVSDRCHLISCDLLNNYFHKEVADMAVGVAILHHLVDPSLLIKAAIGSVKKGGHAIFLEPFQEGNLVLRMVYDTIVKRYHKEVSFFNRSSRKQYHKGISFLQSIALDIHARSNRRDAPGGGFKWKDLDDKWLFTKAYFYEIAKEMGDVEVSFVNLHAKNEKPFLAQTRYYIESLAQLPFPDALPKWAWKMVEEADDLYMATQELRDDFLLEAGIVFHRKGD